MKFTSSRKSITLQFGKTIKGNEAEYLLHGKTLTFCSSTVVITFWFKIQQHFDLFLFYYFDIPDFFISFACLSKQRVLCNYSYKENLTQTFMYKIWNQPSRKSGYVPRALAKELIFWKKKKTIPTLWNVTYSALKTIVSSSMMVVIGYNYW